MGRRSSFTARQKADIVLSVITKQTTIAQVCRRHGITVTTFARWREQALEGMEVGLQDNYARNGREAELEHEVQALSEVQ